MSNVMSELGLTKDQTGLLFSIQYQITYRDIEVDKSKKSAKLAWLKSWETSVNDYLHSLKGKGSDKIVTNKTFLKQEMIRIRSDIGLVNRTPLYLILLESTLYSPYYLLEQGGKYHKLKFKQDIEYIKMIAKELGINPSLVDKYRTGYQTAIRGITNFWPKMIAGALVGAFLLAVTAALAAPMIGALLAPAGLYGAAATSAGLAALGGGAIAAGGAGIAGGIATVVAGGAILGVGSGLGVGKLLAASPKFTLSQAAKLEVVMREITLSAQKDVRLAQEIILEQRNAVKLLDDKLFELQKEEEKNKEKINNLKTSIKHLRKAIDRNRKLALESQ